MSMGIPRPPKRCPWCNAFDSWESTPQMVRRVLDPKAGPEYEDHWTCGICYRIWRIPMPVDPRRYTELPDAGDNA